MKLFAFVIFYIFIVTSSLAEEIRAELSLISPPSILKEGDIVEGILKVWPVENADLNEFKKIESTTLAGALYITEVENVGVSINNADVVEAKLLLIVKRFAEKAPQEFIYQGKSISIQVPPLNIAPSEKSSGEYYVMDQGTFYSNLGKIIAGLALIALLLFMILKRKKLLSYMRRFKSDPIALARKRFNEQFMRANIREDYEKIYALRREWLSLITESHAINNFFEVMLKHQYRKSWTDEDSEEVRKAFDYIRGSFR